MPIRSWYHVCQTRAPQSGSRMSTVHGSLPPARMKKRGMGDCPFVTVTRPCSDYCSRISWRRDQHSTTKLCTMKMVHTLVSMRSSSNSQTMVGLVPTNNRTTSSWRKRPFAPAGGHGSADATSGASDAGGGTWWREGTLGDADATSGASN